MIPWLLVIDLLSKTDEKLSTLVNDMISKYPCSGEINFKVIDTQKAIDKVIEHFADQNPSLDYTDGVSANFGDWRFNIRASNTEPLLRLNVETKSQEAQSINRHLSQLKQLITS